MGLRRLATGVLAVILVAGGGVGALVFLSSRDSSTFGAQTGPGRLFADQGRRHLAEHTLPSGFRYASDPPTSGPHVPVLPARDGRPLSSDELLQALELGNVSLVYGDRRLEAPLRLLAVRLAGRYTRALAAAGQAVLLDFRPGSPGVTAVAWRHLLRAARPADPGLRSFIEFWLGRGAGAG